MIDKTICIFEAPLTGALYRHYMRAASPSGAEPNFTAGKVCALSPKEKKFRTHTKHVRARTYTHTRTHASKQARTHAGLTFEHPSINTLHSHTHPCSHPPIHTLPSTGAHRAGRADDHHAGQLRLRLAVHFRDGRKAGRRSRGAPSPLYRPFLT